MQLSQSAAAGDIIMCGDLDIRFAAFPSSPPLLIILLRSCSSRSRSRSLTVIWLIAKKRLIDLSESLQRCGENRLRLALIYNSAAALDKLPSLRFATEIRQAGVFAQIYYFLDEIFVLKT